MAIGNMLTNGKFQAIGDDGKVVSLGELYVTDYATGEPATTYQDAGLTSANPYPVVLSLSGKANVFLGDGTYNLELKNSLGVVVWSLSNYSFGTSPTAILDKIKTVDGYKSGLDSDTVRGQIPNISADTIIDLFGIDYNKNPSVNLLGYSDIGDGGFGVFRYDETESVSNHNGGTILSSDIPFPTDWTNQEQLKSWYLNNWEASTTYSIGDLRTPTTSNGAYYKCITAGTSGATEPTWTNGDGDTISDGSVVWIAINKNGCWKRQYVGAVNVKWFGAKDITKPEYSTFDSASAINAAFKFPSAYIPIGVFYTTTTLSQYGNILGESREKSIIHCEHNGIFIHQQGKVKLSNFTIECVNNKPVDSIGIYSTYLSTHQSIFSDITVVSFETNILVDSWINEFINIESKKATYGLRISTKTGSEPNLIKISNSNFYYSDYGVYIDTSNTYNCNITNCNMEHNDIGLYSNGIKLLAITNCYFESNNTKDFDLNNSSVALSNIKYDKFSADKCELLIENYTRFNDQSANITNSKISYAAVNSLYRFLRGFTNTFLNTAVNTISSREAVGYDLGSRYSSSLSKSNVLESYALFNDRDGHGLKIERINDDTKGATGIYFKVPATVSRTNVVFRIRMRGKGNFKVVNDYSDSSYSQFQGITLNETEYYDFVTELDTSSSSHNVVGIVFSYNIGDYMVIDSVAIGNGTIPSFYTSKRSVDSSYNTQDYKYDKEGDKLYNTNLTDGNPEGWICTVSGTPGTWVPFGIINNTTEKLQLLGSGVDTLSLTNATSISIPNIATKSDDVASGQFYSDAGTIKIKS